MNFQDQKAKKEIEKINSELEKLNLEKKELKKVKWKFWITVASPVCVAGFGFLLVAKSNFFTSAKNNLEATDKLLKISRYNFEQETKAFDSTRTTFEMEIDNLKDSLNYLLDTIKNKNKEIGILRLTKNQMFKSLDQERRKLSVSILKTQEIRNTFNDSTAKYHRILEVEKQKLDSVRGEYTSMHIGFTSFRTENEYLHGEQIKCWQRMTELHAQLKAARDSLYNRK